ncbi:MAG: rRNA pseudouridine synthase [Candidatus Coatesbacteria bacterium]|nr:rRNA pseudouridine synthase [Candidatus Coatesbacteria bacterium]
MKRHETANSNASCDQRLHKVLAAAGVGARRKCEELMTAGQVSVNGEVVTDLSFKLDPAGARIEVQGKRIDLSAEPVYFIVNKPKGMLSTCSDPEGRPTVLDLVPGRKERLFPVGRLDLDSQGLMLLTNDGEIAQILTHPRFEVEREYLVKVRGIPSEATLDRIRRGVRLEDGRAWAKHVEIHTKTSSNSWLQVVVTEGRNRMLKRMFQALGHPVSKLKRIRLFYLRLGDIPEGAAVPLQAQQVDMLRRRCRKLSSPSVERSESQAQPARSTASTETRRQPATPDRRDRRKKRTRRAE